MEKGKYINDLLQPAILSINNSALLVKCHSRSMIKAFKETIYYNIRDDGFSNIE